MFHTLSQQILSPLVDSPSTNFSKRLKLEISKRYSEDPLKFIKISCIHDLHGAALFQVDKISSGSNFHSAALLRQWILFSSSELS
jgi:hypothetical protein